MITNWTARSSAEPASGWTMGCRWVAVEVPGGVGQRDEQEHQAARQVGGQRRLPARAGPRGPAAGSVRNEDSDRGDMALTLIGTTDGETVTDVTSRRLPLRHVAKASLERPLVRTYGGQERRQEAGRFQATLASLSQRRPCGTWVTSSDGEPARMASEGATWSARTRRARVTCGLQRPSSNPAYAGGPHSLHHPLLQVEQRARRHHLADEHVTAAAGTEQHQAADHHLQVQVGEQRRQRRIVSGADGIAGPQREVRRVRGAGRVRRAVGSPASPSRSHWARISASPPGPAATPRTASSTGAGLEK